jgi:hypothetical protein
MKRLFILSALFSVLLAMSQPLFACTMDMASHDCCPAGTHDPCDDDTGTPTGTGCPAMALCAASQDVPVVVVQAQKEPQPALPGTASGADPPACPAAVPHAPPAPARAAASTSRTDHAAITAALTWLHTARLRR